jgi:hypothetical protein
MPRLAQAVRVALLLGALGSSACSINLVKHHKDAEMLHEQVHYYKWLYVQGFYRTEPELMKRAALHIFGMKASGDEHGEDAPDRVEKLLLRLEQELEKRSKSEPKQP